MFGQEQNLAYIFHLKQELAKINQGTKTVTEYYGDLEVKWDEIGLYSHTTHLKALEQDKKFQFLSGLDPSYEPICAQILLSKELPKLRAVVAMVQREESRRTLMNPHPALEPESQAFTAHHRNQSFKGEIRGETTTHCDNCKMEGHSWDACWFLYPELQPKRKDRGGGDHTKKKGVDHDWERKGHCAVNLDETVKTKARDMQDATSADTAQLHSDFSQAQQDQLENLPNQLLKTLNNRGTLSSNCVQSFLHYDNCWVIDSGATDHMTDSLDLLQNNRKAHNYRPVIIANDSQVPIDQIGTTNILSNNISGVLYLPNFTSNLLFVSKITKELNYNVIFSLTNVVFQDIVTKRTIGEGKLDNGLYYLDISNKALAANSVEDNKLWHWRIDHASDLVLNKLLNLRNLDNSTCDICRFAK
jgi:hypothetical protein